MLFSLQCLSFYQVGLAPFDPITTFSDKQCQFERWNTDTRWEPQIIFHKDFASPGMLSFQTIMPAGAGYTKDDEVKNIPGFFLVPDNGHAIFKGSFFCLHVEHVDAHTLLCFLPLLQHFSTITGYIRFWNDR